MDELAVKLRDVVIRQVEVLRVAPNDVIVLSVDEEIPEEDVVWLRKNWVESTGLENRVVVLDGGIEVCVLSP